MKGIATLLRSTSMSFNKRRTGAVQLHHLFHQAFQRAFIRPVLEAGSKSRPRLTLRQDFATHLLQAGHYI